jgi:hypothetical protein
MTTRTTTKTVRFHRPFYLKGVDRLLPPADYRVVTDEELIAGFSFAAYRRVSTVIFVPAESGCAVEMVSIDPLDLQVIQDQDAGKATKWRRRGGDTMNAATILKLKGSDVITTTADKSLLESPNCSRSMVLVASSLWETTARSQASCRSAISCARSVKLAPKS